MAQALKESHGLLALRVAFAAVPGEPQLTFTLERFRDGMRGYAREWSFPLAAADVPALLQNGRSPAFSLPPELTSALPESLREAEAADGEPLWLHLVKPYGYLGALRWERILATVCGRPIFRLPDFLESPRENRTLLEIALIWDLPRAANSELLVRTVVEAWLKNPSRELVRLHLFCADPQLAAAAATWGQPGLTVHPAVGLMNASGSQQSAFPMFDWIRKRVAPAAVDALHVVARASFELGRSHLLLSAEKGSGAQPVFFLSPADISSFLNQVGAWSFVFAGPADGSMEVGVRHFVDAVSQARPGPAVYHELSPGGVESELADLLAVLFSTSAVEPPAVKSAFVYCQPGLVCADSAAAEISTIPGLHQNEDLLSQPWGETGTEQAPNWMASVQRVIEEFGLEKSREAAGDVLLRDLLVQVPKMAESMEISRGEDVIQKTLDDVQWLVRRSVADAARLNEPEAG